MNSIFVLKIKKIEGTLVFLYYVNIKVKQLSRGTAHLLILSEYSCVFKQDLGLKWNFDHITVQYCHFLNFNVQRMTYKSGRFYLEKIILQKPNYFKIMIEVPT